MKERLLVVAVLLPIGLLLILFGGVPYSLFVTIILALASWEYTQMFCKSGWQPSKALVVTGTALLALERSFVPFQYADSLLSVLVLVCISYYLYQFERGRDEAAIDFGITLGGILYIGWLGSYLISLRNLPGGLWWTLLVLPTVWLVDVGAFFIGTKFGKRPMAPRLSPKKTWEGYMGGAISGVVFGMLFAYLWGFKFPGMTITMGAVVGLVLGVLSPLGDLGESMFKRMAGVKDSSKVLPGHGGIFDRIDSWIWAGVLGYFLISGFWMV